MLLKLLIQPRLSRMAGAICDARPSRLIIPWFIKTHRIRMEDYENTSYRSFNQFFCRRIKPSARRIDPAPDALIAPCDGLLSTYQITNDLVIPVKGSRYRISDLLKHPRLARQYEGGTCLVFRLCVNHYHRYIYLDDGRKGENHFIPGVLHTVRPIALRQVPVFTENAREYTVLHTDHFGNVVQIEVGAMLVGRIRNHDGSGPIRRGQEKGFFEYGGSTIILLLKKDTAQLQETYRRAAAENREIPVQVGQRLN